MFWHTSDFSSLSHVDEGFNNTTGSVQVENIDIMRCGMTNTKTNKIKGLIRGLQQTLTDKISLLYEQISI